MATHPVSRLIPWILLALVGITGLQLVLGSISIEPDRYEITLMDVIAASAIDILLLPIGLALLWATLLWTRRRRG